MSDFDVRGAGVSGVIFTCSHVPGEALSMSIEEGDEVSLKIDGEGLVVDIEEIDGDLYFGSVRTILGSIDDLDIGDVVTFSLENIFARIRD